MMRGAIEDEIRLRSVPSVRRFSGRGRGPGRASESRGGSHGFTLFEILVVVVIIALLVVILLPSRRWAREQTKTAHSTTQIRQLMAAAPMYTGEFKERLPGTGIVDDG